jgi:hypothetical protein
VTTFLLIFLYYISDTTPITIVTRKIFGSFTRDHGRTSPLLGRMKNAELEQNYCNLIPTE